MNESKINTPEEAAAAALFAAGLTLATAESCTGGLVAKRLTDLPGISRVYLGGGVTYANSAKTAIAGVRKETLAAHGAVSEQVACEMAAGIRAALGADVAVSTTGIAGPGGGTPEKPVGLVYVGFSTGDGTKAYRLCHDSSLSREEIRERTVDFALGLIAKL